MQPEEVEENFLEEFVLKLNPEGGLNIEISKTKENYYKSDKKKLLLIIDSQLTTLHSFSASDTFKILSSKNNPEFSYCFVWH